MPSARDFLRRVLPANGAYCLSSSRRAGGKLTLMLPFTGQDPLDAEAQLRSRAGYSVGVSLGAWPDVAGATARKRAQVSWARAWAVDLDVGAAHPYPDPKAALRAAAAFTRHHSLPPFTLVSSGTGLHLYWSTDRDLPLVEWQRVADGLRAAFRPGGLDVTDEQVTSDPSSPMRYPGSTNPKCGRRAQLVHLAPAAPLEAFASLLAPAGVSTDDLAGEDGHAYQGPPADFTDVLRGCRQVRAQARAQHLQSYKSWHALIGVVSRCEDADRWAHVVSHNHPGYRPADTDKMLAGWRTRTGPTTCAYFASVVPHVCDGCPVKGKITTPVQLSSPKAATPPAFVATAPVGKEWEPLGLPYGYRVGEDAVWRLDRESKEWLPVASYAMYVTRVGPDADYGGQESVSIAWRRRADDWEVTTIPCAHVSGQASRELSKDLGAAGIPLSYEGGREIGKMLRAWIENLNKDKESERIEIRNSMGWDSRGESFTLGFHRVHRNGAGKPAMSQSRIGKGAEQLAKCYGRTGDLAEWYKAVGHAYSQGVMALPFAALVSLSAPLWRFQGLPGCSLCFYSPETGTGKTAALKAAQSIYGDPRRLLHSAHGSLTANMKLLGAHCHTLMTIDEMTPMIVSNPTMMGEMLYAVSEGKEKQRLTRTATLQEAGSWSTVLMFTSNVSPSQGLEVARYHSAAQAMRLLNLRVHPHEMFSRSSTEGERLVTALEGNYGHLGLAWVARLVEAGPEEIGSRLTHFKEEFDLAFPGMMTGEERFWRQLFELAFAAGEWVKRLPFDSRAVIRWALEQVPDLREQATDLDEDAYALVAEFLVEHEFARVVVFQDVGATGTTPRWGFFDVWPRQPVRVRVEVDRKGAVGSRNAPVVGGRAFLDWRAFRRWMAERGRDARLASKQLEHDGALAEGGRRRKNLGAHTGHRTPGREAMVVDLAKHPALRGLLDAASLPAKQPNQGSAVVPIR